MHHNLAKELDIGLKEKMLNITLFSENFHRNLAKSSQEDNGKYSRL